MCLYPFFLNHVVDKVPVPPVHSCPLWLLFSLLGIDDFHPAVIMPQDCTVTIPMLSQAFCPILAEADTISVSGSGKGCIAALDIPGEPRGTQIQ